MIFENTIIAISMIKHSGNKRRNNQEGTGTRINLARSELQWKSQINFRSKTD